MALIYRMRGGLGPHITHPIKQVLYALPYAYITYLYVDSFILVFISLGLTVLALVKGHGHNMDLGDWPHDADYEWYEFHKPLHGRISEYWYDVIGMCISGLTYTLPSGIISLNVWLAISGILKAPAYMIGWKVQGRTELGEWLTGGFAGLSLALLL